MSLFQQELDDIKERTAELGVTPEMAMSAPVSNSLLGIEPPKHWSEEALEEDGGLKFFGKMLLGGFTGLTPLLFPEMIGGKARYANDLEIYKDNLEHAREQTMRQRYVDVLNDPNATHTDRISAAALVGGVGNVDPNPINVPAGQSVLSAGTGNLLYHNPRDPQLSTAEKNLRKWDELNPEPQQGTTAHDQWAEQRNQFFSSAVRANQVVSNVVRSGTDASVIGPEEEYHDSSAKNAASVEGAKTGVQTSAKMFADAKAGAEEAYTAVQEYDFSLQNANEVLTGLRDGKYTTNVARAMMLDYLGLGGIDDGTLLAMGTDEAIQKVQGFNGHTTDFEYGQAFNAAFARLRNNTDVNIGVMEDVIKGLENARTNAASAYQSGVYDASNAAQQTVEKRWVERMNGRNKEKYPKAPKIGFEREGRRYMGGDPTDIRNWLEIQQ